MAGEVDYFNRLFVDENENGTILSVETKRTNVQVFGFEELSVLAWVAPILFE